MRQKDWRDPDVVIDHLAFGEPDFRVKNLVFYFFAFVSGEACSCTLRGPVRWGIPVVSPS